MIKPFNFMDLGDEDEYDYDNYSSRMPDENIAQILPILMQLLGIGAQQPQRNDYYNQFRNQVNPEPEMQENPYASSNFGKGSSLMDLLRQRESSGNYRAQNNLGYSGAYQFGAPALETVGYLRKGAGRLGNKALNNPSNWMIEGGKEAFLSNPQLQDEAMRKLMSSNKITLQRMGLINQKTDPSLVNAMLAAAHISGPGGVKALLKGQNRRDAYGTGAQEYFNLGKRAKINV